jgi:hypothetical protein
MAVTWDETLMVFARIRTFSAEVEERLAACRDLPAERLYEQFVSMEGDELPPLPLDTETLLAYALLKAHEGMLFYVKKWLVNAEGDMTAESAVEWMSADRKIDLLFRDPPMADVLRFRRRAGALVYCMKCGAELPMWNDEAGAELPYEKWLNLPCASCGTTPRQNGAR